jgi:simple sugar transport system permease protein
MEVKRTSLRSRRGISSLTRPRILDPNTKVLTGTAVVVFLVLSATLDRFLTLRNIRSMFFQLPEFAFMAFGMALCMLAGGIDLSIVSIANLSSVLAGYTLLGIVNRGGNAWFAIAVGFLVALVAAALCGLFNGLLVARTHIVPMLATLSTMLFYTGITHGITLGRTVTGFPLEFAEIGIFAVWGVPFYFVVLIAVTVLLSFVLEATFFGKSVYLYGGNKTAALFSGMRIDSVVLKVYTLSGFLSGVGGLAMMSRVNSARVGYGEGYVLQALLVCVLGGISVAGGEGRIVGVFLGILILQMLQSAFSLLGLAPYYRNFIWGLTLICVMIANYYLDIKRRRA